MVISRGARGETLVTLPGAQPTPMTWVDAGGGYRIQIEDRRVTGLPATPVQRPVRVGQPEQNATTPAPDPENLL
jgi:hypothetical protein